MLQLTKRTEYGLIALIHLADRGVDIASVREIHEHYPMPKRLLAEVLKDLCRAGIVESQRGATGGYGLARPAESVTLGDVIAALEGEPSITSCQGLGAMARSGVCDVESVCPIRSPLQRIRHGIWALLQHTTLRSLADSSVDPEALFSSAPTE